MEKKVEDEEINLICVVGLIDRFCPDVLPFP